LVETASIGPSLNDGKRPSAARLDGEFRHDIEINNMRVSGVPRPYWCTVAFLPVDRHHLRHDFVGALRRDAPSNGTPSPTCSKGR
jgi:hypothetical protein